MARAVDIVLSAAERSDLERRLRRRTIARADAMRAEIVLLAADGYANSAIARTVGATRKTVQSWRRRFARDRLDGLDDEPRCGAPRKIGDDRIEEIVTQTLEARPANATHWSTRGMAKASGVSASSVHRIWRAFCLQPHRVETFKLSKDPQFIEKVRDIIGLYLNPPERALVLCVDEKSQIQALDRTQPLLPMRPGQIERRTHDYERHGTTTLFAALVAATNADAEVKAGTVIGKCMPRHRAQEFRKFLDEVERSMPADLDVHVVMDNASSHKTKLIRDWFARRPNWHIHFTRPPHPGSTRSSASSRCCHRSRSSAAPTDRSASSWRQSRPSSTPAMQTPRPSAGSRRPTTSSPRSSASAAAPSTCTPRLGRYF
jgi:transposase